VRLRCTKCAAQNVLPMRYDRRCRISQTNSGLEPGPLQASAARPTGRIDGILTNGASLFPPPDLLPPLLRPSKACVPFSEQPVLQPISWQPFAGSWLLARGLKAVADMNRNSAQDTIKRITAEVGRAFAVEADVTSEADVRRMVDEAHRTMGGLDGLVLNVGIFGKVSLDAISTEEWNHIYDNVRGPTCFAAGRRWPNSMKVAPSCSFHRSPP
jgi:hypothetical protein